MYIFGWINQAIALKVTFVRKTNKIQKNDEGITYSTKDREEEMQGTWPEEMKLEKGEKIRGQGGNETKINGRGGKKTKMS